MDKSIYIKTFELTQALAFFLQILPIVLYFLFRKKIKDKVLWVIVYILIVGFFVDGILWYLGSKGKNTFSVQNLFTLLELVSVLYFFRQIIESSITKKLISIVIMFFSAYWLLLLILKYKPLQAQLLNIEYICFIAFSVSYYYQQLKYPGKLLIYNNPRFWIVTAYLIYTAGTFFLFLYFYILNTTQLLEVYVPINSIFLLIKTILLSIAMFAKDENLGRKKFELT